MPLTNFPHRLLLIVPVARVAALQAWLTANLGPDWADALSTGLVPAALPASTPAATHFWCSCGCTDPQAKKLLGRLASQSGVAAPAQWDGWTRPQKRDWLAGVRDQVYATIGVYVAGCFNDADWDSPDDALVACGLQRQVTATTP